MKTKTASVAGLHAEYAHRLAHVAGLNVTEYDRTAGGLAELSRDVADRLSSLDQNRDWLEEIADNFSAVSRISEDSRDARRLLEVNANTLDEAVRELELS